MSLLAGIGMSRVHVHSSRSPDGQCGGTPHMHLACTELYVALEGTGAAEFLTADGPRRVPLAPGAAVQFTPGTVHRLVTDPDDELRVMVVMENSHLNEEGDAVFAFPDEDLTDPGRYADLAAAPDAEAARSRRDRAVVGFTRLTAAWEGGASAGLDALGRFHRRAVALAAPRAVRWGKVVEDGPAAMLAGLSARVAAVSAGDGAHLMDARVTPLPGPVEEEMRDRMCGRLWPYR